MSESSRAQAGADRQVSGEHPANTDLGPRITAPAPLREPDLALLPRIASQIALLNLMRGSSSQARRTRPGARLQPRRADDDGLSIRRCR